MCVKDGVLGHMWIGEVVGNQQKLGIKSYERKILNEKIMCHLEERRGSIVWFSKNEIKSRQIVKWEEYKIIV